MNAPHRIGEVLAERYELLAVMGRGTTGVVYRARDLYVSAEEEIVALKLIHRELHGDPQIAGRFRREAEILRRLRGPHLCKLLEVVEEDGLLMLALEYVEGMPLDAYATRHGPLPLAEVATLLGQVCEALSVAHAAGVVHRDLKPSNVLVEGAVTGEPRSFRAGLSARVVDFGLAKIFRRDGEASGTGLTERDMIFGTPDYMSPEQVAGEPVDHRCDVYAAGIILFELLTGRLPYDTPGALTTMHAHLSEPIPSACETAPHRHLPRAVDEVVRKALAKKPADRYESALDLARELSAACEPVSLLGETDPDLGSEVPTRRDEVEPTLRVEGLPLDAEGSEAVAARESAAENDSTGGAGTTMRSAHEHIDASHRRGARVKVVVSGEEPSTPSPRERSAARPSPRAGTGGGWIALAVLAAALAIATGVWLGLQ